MTITSALILAGGRGERLRPLTDTVPKPMLVVGGRPLLAHTLELLANAHVERVTIATSYLAEQIEGRYWGPAPKITFQREEQPLGTGGALRAFGLATIPRLVMNGDLLTDIDLRAMATFHERRGALLTMAVHQGEVRTPYGLVLTDGSRVTGIREKAGLETLINAGIYLLDPAVWDYLPRGRFDMTDLVARLLAYDEPVAAFPIREGWMDIGTPEDLERARAQFAEPAYV